MCWKTRHKPHPRQAVLLCDCSHSLPTHCPNQTAVHTRLSVLLSCQQNSAIGQQNPREHLATTLHGTLSQQRNYNPETIVLFLHMSDSGTYWPPLTPVPAGHQSAARLPFFTPIRLDEQDKYSFNDCQCACAGITGINTLLLCASNNLLCSLLSLLCWA